FSIFARGAWTRTPWLLYLPSHACAPQAKRTSSSPPRPADLLRLHHGRAATMADTAVTVVRIILAIILPPLGVFLKHGIKIDFWICLLLSFFAYLPGIIYAVWVIVK
ncbi:unnamed protein product, partial [Urochloa humidicola]